MKNTRLLKPWTYVGLSVLYAIPVIGLIFLLIHTFSKKNLNRRNFARSFWCWVALGLMALALFIGIGYAQGYDVLQDMRDAASSLPVSVPGLSPKPSYDAVYEDYAQQLRDAGGRLTDELDAEPGRITDELLEEKLAQLTDITVEGEARLADVWMALPSSSHEEYEQWLEKLRAVYEEQAQALRDFAEGLS